MTTKRKTTKEKPAGSISIGGDVGGTGNVVGHGSSSHVSIRNEAGQAAKTPAQTPSRERTMWVRLAAFLLALVGILAAVALFARLLQGFDAPTAAELVLAALVAALGLSGTIKPQALAALLAKLAGKG